MVRIKHRYLLLEILYPDTSSWAKPNPNPSLNSKATTTSQSQSQFQLQIHASTPDTLTPGFLARMVRDEVAEIYGDWGIGRLGVGGSGVSVKYLSPATSTAIIRCPRASFRLVWSALTYMSRVPESPSGSGSGGGGKRAPTTRSCVFRVVRVSGTMRKAEEEAIRRARREIVRWKGLEEVGVLGALVGGGDGDSAKKKKMVVNKKREDEDEGSGSVAEQEVMGSDMNEDEDVEMSGGSE